MSVGAEQPRPGVAEQPSVPAPEFAVISAAHLPFAAAPTMVFSASASEPGGHEIQSIALSVQVTIDPASRGYDGEARERLSELFGPPATWTPSTHGIAWARLSAVVAGFAGSTSFALEIPCTYDLEVAAAKYFYAIADGAVPLSFHFSGTVFYREPGGALQIAPVPWSRTAKFRMPIAAWRRMMAEHYPGGGWIRLSDETLARLNRRRAARGLPSFDACLEELLEVGRGPA